MDALEPVFTAPLFAPLHAELLALLRGLTPDDWHRPTSAGAWRVRDIVAHLLDVDLRKLSTSRDGHVPTPESPLDGFAELVRFLNGLNAEWVRASRRLSPRVLVGLLEFTGPEVATLMAALPAYEPSLFPVDWAGERRSENWMDAGREYTERWHHQMQIRDAVGAAGLTSRAWLHPVLDLSVRALPRAYRLTHAPEATVVVVEVTGEAGDTWSLARSGEAWHLGRGRAARPVTRLQVDADAAWRCFFNAPAAARARATIQGDMALAQPFFEARAVMVEST